MRLVSSSHFLSSAPPQLIRLVYTGNGEKYGHLYEGLDLVTDVSERSVVKKGEDGKWALEDLVF